MPLQAYVEFVGDGLIAADCGKIIPQHSFPNHVLGHHRSSQSPLAELPSDPGIRPVPVRSATKLPQTIPPYLLQPVRPAPLISDTGLAVSRSRRQSDPSRNPHDEDSRALALHWADPDRSAFYEPVCGDAMPNYSLFASSDIFRHPNRPHPIDTEPDLSSLFHLERSQRAGSASGNDRQVASNATPESYAKRRALWSRSERRRAPLEVLARTVWPVMAVSALDSARFDLERRRQNVTIANRARKGKFRLVAPANVSESDVTIEAYDPTANRPLRILSPPDAGNNVEKLFSAIPPADSGQYLPANVRRAALRYAFGQNQSTIGFATYQTRVQFEEEGVYYGELDLVDR